MSGLKKAIVAVALLLSAGLNAWLLLHNAPRAASTECPRSSPHESANGANETAACHVQLRRCQRQAIEPLAALVGQPDDRQRLAPPDNKPVTTVDLELQSSVLCDIAKQKLRQRWRQKRDQVVAGVLRDLADGDKQARSTRDELERFAALFGLGEPQKTQLAQVYATKRTERMTAIRAALKSRPADFATVIRELKALYATEDALVRGLLGDQARDQLRAAELERRTTILALAAAIGDQPWEPAIAW